MARKYKATIPDKSYFITITSIGWIELFTRLNHRYKIINSLKYCQNNKGLEIFSFCIMPSHLHLFCCAHNGKKLSDIMHDFKTFTSKQLLSNIKNETRKQSRMDALVIC